MSLKWYVSLFLYPLFTHAIKTKVKTPRVTYGAISDQPLSLYYRLNIITNCGGFRFFFRTTAVPSKNEVSANIKHSRHFH